MFRILTSEGAEIKGKTPTEYLIDLLVSSDNEYLATVVLQQVYGCKVIVDKPKMN